MFKNRMRPVHPGEILRKDYLVPLGMLKEGERLLNVISEDCGIRKLAVISLMLWAW
jgi:plasmid maintenance system antidote protein VapI